MKTCSTTNCTQPANARGMCNSHYGRWRRHTSGELSSVSLPSITHADWTVDARCAQSDPDSWFPEDLGLGVKSTRARAETAIRVCEECPVRSLCAKDFWHEPHGIIAGYTAAERKEMTVAP